MQRVVAYAEPFDVEAQLKEEFPMETCKQVKLATRKQEPITAERDGVNIQIPITSPN